MELWHESSTLLGQGIPSLVVCDFNYTYSSQEKRGGRVFIDGVQVMEFREFTEGNSLVDLEVIES